VGGSAEWELEWARLGMDLIERIDLIDTIEGMRKIEN
jgi:hypothetical protein